MSDQELIGRLLRLADPGPELPSGGEQQIRAAVRPVWQRAMRARARRRYTIGGAALAAAAAAVIVVATLLPRQTRTPSAALPVARVELVRGPVDEVLRRNPIVAGTRLRTGPASRAALRLSGGESLRLDAGTEVRLVSAHRLELERGAIYIDSGGRHAMPVEVETRFGSVRDIGTRFEVRAEDNLGVVVREGSVGVSTPQEHFHVAAGFAATVSAAGSHDLHSLGAPGQSWTASVAPPFAIEGRSIADLLEWCSSETGLAVRYSDREAERIARSTRLHGLPVDALPDDLAAMILPTAGLAAARRAGTLLVMRQPPPG